MSQAGTLSEVLCT